MARLENPPVPVSLTAIADAVWDEAVAGHVGAGSTGERVERLDLLQAGGTGDLTPTRAVLLSRLSLLAAGGAGQLNPAQLIAMVPKEVAPGGYEALRDLSDKVFSSSGTDNTYGAYVELVASTARAFRISAIGIGPVTPFANIDYAQVEIATGVGGSEVAFFTGQIAVKSIVTGDAQAVILGLSVPTAFIASGTRVAARIADGRPDVLQYSLAVTVIDDADYRAVT